ncbi:ERF family protein [Cohaesibacter celericrescens]|uniref:ERF family protein n=1 Tax=Cohaesibacter celericrescens TaxID=2067669 RepID=UPI003561348A
MSNELAERQESNVVPIHQSETTALMSMIANAASDPNSDIDKMERLYAMFEKAKSMEAEQKFNEALAKAQSEILPISKNKFNDQTKSRYANLEAVLLAVTPVITRHGFSMSFGNEPSTLDGHYRVTCKLSHSAGHSRDYQADLPADTTGIAGKTNKTGIHGFGSTIAYGRRYLESMIWNIATSDDDGNAAGNPSLTQEQIDELRDLIDEAGKSVPDFCKYAGVNSLAEIYQSNFQKAKSVLTTKIANQKAAS